MTRETRRRWIGSAAALTGLLVVGAAATALLPKGWAGEKVDRTLELSMKDFAFNGNNPVLRLRAGETVKVVVRNDEPDPRVLHSFRIPGLDVRCDTDIKPGEQREFVLRVPATGDYVYTCCTHPGMGGSIEIQRGR